jgi:hypothetical protein
MPSSETNYHFPAVSLLAAVAGIADPNGKNRIQRRGFCSQNQLTTATKFTAREIFNVWLHTFDSFECAIHALAPVCPHCNCRIVGHGVEADGQIFCCVHCARAAGKTQLKDRV